ncbi:peptidyl-prolyl cis-trans isomerase [Haloechinothrix salitolerans]|uniref:Peptidyl-prolyl cis-trans isomerase n=1 Tax=Haloechinothrix salitolerans TaxID=926830 RepID=A0ABW2BVH2_9PSEU
MMKTLLHVIARAVKRVGWPSARAGRVAVSACTVIALLLTGGFFWLHSGRAAFGTYAGEGALSFVPAWLPADVAFRYGDKLVTEDELNQHSDMLRVLYGVTTPKKEDGKAQFRKDVAKSYAVSLVLQRAAGERDISIADKQARDALTRFVSERIGEGPGAYNQFIQSLSDEGTSEKVVLNELKRRLAIAKLSDAVVGDVGKVTDKEVKQAFVRRKDSLGTPERRAISNIVVKSKDEARRVLREIRSGTSFAKVARTVSLDGSTRDKGGRLGTLSKRQLEKSYAEVAFSTDKGELFGPVKNQHGWNVGRVNKILPPKPAEFSEIKKSLAQQLRTETALERWRSWLGERIADAGIVYADNYRPADPDALPTMAPSRLSGPR